MALVISQSSASPARERAESRIKELQGQIELAHERNAALEEALKYRRSDAFVIAAAKRELSLVEPGDIRLDLEGPLPPEPVEVEPSHRPTEPLSAPPGFLDFGYIRAWVDVLTGRN